LTEITDQLEKEESFVNDAPSSYVDKYLYNAILEGLKMLAEKK